MTMTPMNIADRIREIVAKLDKPFLLQDITSQMPEIGWRDVNSTLHRLATRRELEKDKIENPKGHGMVTRFTKTARLREPGQQRYGVRSASSDSRDIGSHEACTTAAACAE